MKLFKTIPENDEMFGNDWSTNLIFSDGSNEWLNNERPTQYAGVHGLIHVFEDEWHILCEDDGYFRTVVIVTENEIRKIHHSLSKLIENFRFKGNYKVTFDTHIQMDRKISEFIDLKIIPRTESAPLIDMTIHGEKIVYDVNWLGDFIKVLDIDNPIK